jgi:hypothetical protein
MKIKKPLFPEACSSLQSGSIWQIKNEAIPGRRGLAKRYIRTGIKRFKTTRKIQQQSDKGYAASVTRTRRSINNFEKDANDA